MTLIQQIRFRVVGPLSRSNICDDDCQRIFQYPLPLLLFRHSRRAMQQVSQREQLGRTGCPNRDSITLNCVMTPELSERMFHTSAMVENQPQTKGEGFQVQVQNLNAQSRATQSMVG
jgi:hypothetical protein